MAPGAKEKGISSYSEGRINYGIAVSDIRVSCYKSGSIRSSYTLDLLVIRLENQKHDTSYLYLCVVGYKHALTKLSSLGLGWTLDLNFKDEALSSIPSSHQLHTLQTVHLACYDLTYSMLSSIPLSSIFTVTPQPAFLASSHVV